MIDLSWRVVCQCVCVALALIVSFSNDSRVCALGSGGSSSARLHEERLRSMMAEVSLFAERCACVSCSHLLCCPATAVVTHTGIRPSSFCVLLVNQLIGEF
jgi:hypothetical protein